MSKGPDARRLLPDRGRRADSHGRRHGARAGTSSPATRSATPVVGSAARAVLLARHPRGSPARCGSGSRPPTRSTPRSTPSANAACATPPSCWPRSATTCSRSRRSFRPDTLGLFIGSFGPMISLSAYFAQTVGGREPTDDEIEPLSRKRYVELLRAMSSSDYALVNDTVLKRLARGLVGDVRRLRPPRDPRARRAPAKRSASARATARIPWPTSSTPGRFTPYTALFNVTGQPAITVPVGVGPDGMRRHRAPQLVCPPAGRGHAAPGRRPDRDRPPVGRPPPGASGGQLVLKASAVAGSAGRCHLNPDIAGRGDTGAARGAGTRQPAAFRTNRSMPPFET